MNGYLKLEQVSKGYSSSGGNIIIACVHDGVITYAQPGCRDYHRYEIKNYDAYCITK